MKNYRLLLCGLIATMLAPASWGTLSVDILDTNIAVGNTGFVDVMISGDPADIVQSHQIELSITPVGGATSSLQFRDPQTSDFRALANFLYSGDSTTGPGISGQVLGNSNYFDFDAGLTTGVAPGTGGRLLARVNLQHAFAGSPSLAIGNQFTVNAVFGGLNGTEFFDDTFANFGVTSADVSAGTVTVTSAIPEPGSMMLFGLGATAVFVRRIRKRPLKALAT